MNLETVKRQRMYNLTCMYFMGIQAGIQSYHAAIEYTLKYFETPEFQRWANHDKTVIILNGVDSNSQGTEYYSKLEYIATMQKAQYQLHKNEVPYADFYEPAANNTLTSLSFLVDETVWDTETYPDPVVTKTGDKLTDDLIFQEALSKTYGDKTAFLRIFLKQFRLAS